MKIKSLSIFCAVLGTSLAVMGCETTNRDYSSSARVVDATAAQRSNPASSHQVYPSDSRVHAGAQSNVYAAPQALESSGQVQPVTYSQDYQTVNEPVIEVYNPTAEQGTASNGGAAVVTAEPVAVSSSASGAGVVKPYVPDNTVSGDTYTVKKGDTLYSIAFRYGLDYKTVAANNGIQPPYNIAVGQVIQLNLKTAASAPTYTVKRGDTLYSIARANGQSVDFLAGVNDLREPYTLSVGQVLKLARSEVKGQSTSTVIPVAGQAQAETDSRALKNSQAAQTSASSSPSSDAVQSSTVSKPVVVTGKTRRVGGVTWMWPTQGKIIEQFSLAEQGNKGIDIAGSSGQQVLAAADGQVVYAGNALRGYGNLIIINHSNEFLSAYAHNDALLVSEGQKVVRGQPVARMGSTDAKSVRLHFEIRYRGQSVNPLSYLPK